MGENQEDQQNYQERVSGPPRAVDGPGCTPAFLVVQDQDEGARVSRAAAAGRAAAERVLIDSGALLPSESELAQRIFGDEEFVPCARPGCGKSPVEHIGWGQNHLYVEPE